LVLGAESDETLPTSTEDAVKGRKQMRRLALFFTSLLVLLVFADPAGAADTDGFKAQFTQHLGRGIGADGGPCAAAFCGIGRIVGYGEAELTLLATSVLPTSVAGCGFALAVTGAATIELPEGSTLMLEEAGTYCLPGGSHVAPGNFFASYGNPLEIEASYSIVGGSGVFAGAAGTGTNAIYQAGDTQIAVYSGTLTIS
jgi:hypothetical protein